MISYWSIWYHIVQYDTILYNMMPYCTIWYRIVQYGTILYNMIPYCTIWYHIVQYAIWYHICFFPWPMYKRCAAKNNHRRLENKGELLTTSKWCLKYKNTYFYPLCLPVGVPCRGKIPGKNMHFIYVYVKT